ncbi:hypothetical protein [Planococcus glaciei]|uniref:hypothetical protein n=1 Tax=Planococcus glaciei TaxID=459472 RepID=UPI001C73A1E7|nr:hypothetical protein [Planococcus glaciei]MBX0313292.1 hypothetical protein [Planococcus glaciei]
MNLDLFNFLSWTLIIGFFLCLIIGIVFIFRKKWKSSFKFFAATAGSFIVFLALFYFAYPEELLEPTETSSFEAEGEAATLEELTVEIIELDFDEKKKIISTEITANLPNDTDVLVHLRSDKTNASGEGVALLLDYKAKVMNGKILLDEVPIYAHSGIPQKNANYFLTLDIPINQDSNKEWLEERYDDNYSNLNVRDEGYERYANLDMADTITIPNGFSPEEVMKMTEEKTRLEEEQKLAEMKKKKNTAVDIRFAELNKNPEKHAGAYVKYQGEILQIIEDKFSSVIRLAVIKDVYGYDFNDVIYITYDGTTEFVDEDVITIYGTVIGNYTYESQAGYNISLPHIEADIVE